MRGIGDDWSVSRPPLALRVPSALCPLDGNVIINPEHGDFRRFVIGTRCPISLDERCGQRGIVTQRADVLPCDLFTFVSIRRPGGHVFGALASGTVARVSADQRLRESLWRYADLTYANSHSRTGPRCRKSRQREGVRYLQHLCRAVRRI